MQLIGINLLPLQLTGTANRGQDNGLQFGLKYCPSMDLIAVFQRATALPNEDAAESKVEAPQGFLDDEDDNLRVEVYRLNSQKVFTISIAKTGECTGISDVTWRDDGVILAIATTDNVIRLVNNFSGKIIHTFSSSPDPSNLPVTSPVVPLSPKGKRKSNVRTASSRKQHCIPSLLHYSTHFTNPEIVRQKLAMKKERSNISLDNLLGLNADIETLLKLSADLPRELASIDAETFLPKLSTLPPNGSAEDDVFSTRTSIDAMFHPAKSSARSTSTDVMTIARDDSYIHLRIFDSFEIGTIDLNQTRKMPPGCRFGQIINIVTHPFVEKIFCIVEEEDDGSAARHTRSHDATGTQHTPLHLLSLDLRFLQQSKLTLPVLATKATQLYNLTRYLQQIDVQLAREVKTAFDLPQRFIQNLEEDLKEQDGEGSTFRVAAYHVLLTGEVHGKFKEWLVEQLGDRGIKRWEKAVSECLDLVRRLVCENWIPTVERAGIVVTRIGALAIADQAFGIDKQIVEVLRDTVDIMGIIGEDLLKEVSAEFTGFNAFIRWMKREVEMAGLEDTSEKLDEVRENSDHSEVRKVMQYISERLSNTSVKTYIRDDSAELTTLVGDKDSGLYQSYKRRRLSGREGSPPSMKSLTTELSTHCRKLFQQVASHLRENVFVQHVQHLTHDHLNHTWSSIDGEIINSRIIWDRDHPVIHTIGKHASTTNKLAWTRLSLTDNTITGVDIDLEQDQNVLDIKFVDDDEVVVLVGTSKSIKILAIRLLGDNKFDLYIKHSFDDPRNDFIKAGLKPWKLEVNGRKGRRTLTVLDEQGRGYAVYDLDSTDSDSEDEKNGNIA